MKNIIIVGAGGHGKELLSYIQDARKSDEDIQVVGVIDENKPKSDWAKTNIIGNFDDLKKYLDSNKKKEFSYITAVGNNQVRKKFVEIIDTMHCDNLKAFNLVHPSVYVGDEVELGEGICLAPGSMITTYSKVGKHCILNVNASISHDCIIGDYVNMNPGVTICGDVTIGKGCYIGAQATIIDKVSVGDWTVIGAGAVVTEDIPSNVTAVGVPAKVIKNNS